MEKIRGFEYIDEIAEKFSKDREDNSDWFSLPKRSTKHSAGYDFYAPYDMVIPSHISELSDLNRKEIVKPFIIKTQVKAYMEEDEVLEVFVRSSAPSKLGIVMANSVGIIDSDYYNNPENEGEIGFIVYNLFPFDICINRGEKIGQGIFKKFLKADEDDVTEERVGGYGSTGR